MANYAEEIQSLRALVPKDNFELRVQLFLVGLCILVAWVSLGLYFLPVWFVVHYAFVFLEKRSLTAFPNQNTRGFFFFIVFLNFFVSSTFSALPIYLWSVGTDSYQLASVALMFGSIINVFLNKGRVWQVMVCFLIPTGGFFLLATWGFYQDHGPTAEFYTLLVISLCLISYFFVGTYESYRSYKEHVETRERLVQSQKSEAIANLTGGVAHDFNNLLNIISGNLELIRETTDDNERANYTAQALQAVERGTVLTNHMLAFGRRSLLNPEPVDLELAFVELEHMLSRLLPSTVRLHMEVAKDLPHLFVDENTLHIAIINLCVNSKDAMPAGGVLQVTARLEQTGQTREQTAQSQRVCIKVTDTGTGIPENLQNSVTEPFVTTKTKGSGLGLAMVSGFVHQSNGEMRIKSDGNSGTDISLILPTCDRAKIQLLAPLHAPAHAPMPMPETRIASAKVLIVEDEPQLLKLLSVTLRKEGLELLEATDGDHALELVLGGFEPDIVLTDIVMPGTLQGIELVRLLKKKLPKTRFVVISGYASKAENLDNLMSEDVVFRQKPVQMQELVDLVKGFLNEIA